MKNFKSKVISILSATLLISTLFVTTGCSTGIGNISAGNKEIVNSQETGNLPYASKEEALKALDQIQIAEPDTSVKNDREKNFGTWAYSKNEKMNTRTKVLKQQGQDIIMENNKVASGKFYIPYTGKIVECATKEEVSKIQIDHCVPCNYFWQHNGQNVSQEVREQFANDVENNLFVCDSKTNISKSDKGISEYNVSNPAFELAYAEHWVKVCSKYGVSLTQADYDTIKNILENN